ncbi:MAG: hypothetical protein A3F68_09135 [Acidobacteria bacterium RIFCSPLOWO2_12_FULL_54_10]|nr:MAG: hypothetical protein A3F68_09135 [Acidobacteria bacterium RIFCSPLOWO2_12_FULL_54_10]
MRVKIKRTWWLASPFRPLWLILLVLILTGAIAGTSVFTYYYVRYSRLIDLRLQGPVFLPAAHIYAAPKKLRLGQGISREDLISYLRQAGFSDAASNPTGSYKVIPRAIQIMPGPSSYFSPEAAEIGFSENRISSIVSVNDHFARGEYSLDPLLITNLFDRSREKRRLVVFNDIPRHLVSAILAIEDRRFFEHSGVDYLRILKAAYVDIRAGSVRQGASTITMQLSRSLFLSSERTWKRKLAETLVSFQLERRLSKQDIFEYYCNKIYMGQRGSFTISGVGEAAQAYFNKDIRDLTLPESSFLAGIIQGPNLYSPYRNPERAISRRNQVLNFMADTGAITPAERDEAKNAPLGATPRQAIASEAPHFVDMVRDQLLGSYTEEDLASQSFRIHTTIDLDLQRAAVEAFRVGLAEVDERLAGFRRPRRGRQSAANKDGSNQQEPQVEAVLIALDPRTGALKALIGGRDYGLSQLNRALALRQPGSAFKPFVYAAALGTGISGSVGPPWTSISQIKDEPTTFVYDGRTYTPGNYGDEFYGNVTLRYALRRSLNVSTVKLAQMVGYENIVDLAQRSGMNLKIQPTPAVALGAYEVQPLEIAGSYTVFANGGVHLDPFWISQVRDRNGTMLSQATPKATRVLDPRISFLVTNLMEDVVNRGTGAGVRSRGFTAPVAGKTGTSHDGWFAGYTSNLICIVWVGYDSNEELPLSGASSALPIWTEFMKRAVALPQYSDVRPAIPPPGIVAVEIDPDTNALATPECKNRSTEYFIAGTEPKIFCPRHYIPPAPRATPLPSIASLPPITVIEPVVASAPPPEEPSPVVSSAPAKEPAIETSQPKKKGFFGRIFGVFRGESDQSKP